MKKKESCQTFVIPETLPPKKSIIPSGKSDILLEPGDSIRVYEIEKYESSNFDSQFYETLMLQVKKWGQHFEYKMGVHMGFVIKDLIREGVRYNEDDSVGPFIDGYEGSFEI